MIEPTIAYWQELLDDVPSGAVAAPPFQHGYPVRVGARGVLVLPLRLLPDGAHAVASLIANQASLPVVEAIAEEMAALARRDRPDVIVGLPTLGLTFAPLVAGRLGHTRYVPLGYSRKYWYDEQLSEPIASITSPAAGKRLYLDPNLASLACLRRGGRVCVVDDAISTGASMLAVRSLLGKLGAEIVSIVVAMKQTRRWEDALGRADPELPGKVRAVFGCPMFARGEAGFDPVAGTLPAVP